LLLPEPAAAEQRTLQQVDQALATAEATITRLEREGTISPLIVSISSDLKEVRKSVESLQQTRSAPGEAWATLEKLGIAFIIAWGLVSVAREAARAFEIQANKEIARATAQVTVDEAEVSKRMKAVVDVLREVKR
jgi:hypothetical protein